MWLILSMFHSSFSLSTVNINEYINHFLKILWLIHSYYFVFDSVFEFLIVLQCESLIILFCECCNSLKFCWVLDHWFILSQNMNMLFHCLFLVDYLKDSSKFLFELFIVIKYQWCFVSTLNVTLKISDFLDTLTVFVHNCQNTADEINSMNNNLNWKLKDSLSVTSYYMCVHRSLKCWKWNEKNIQNFEKLVDERVYCISD